MGWRWLYNYNGGLVGFIFVCHIFHNSNHKDKVIPLVHSYLVKALSCLRQHFVVSSRCAMRKMWHNHWNGVAIWYDLYSTTHRHARILNIANISYIISICLPNNPWATFMEFSGAFWLLVEWYIVTKWGLDKLNSICKDQQMREWLGTLAQDRLLWLVFQWQWKPPARSDLAMMG